MLSETTRRQATYSPFRAGLALAVLLLASAFGTGGAKAEDPAPGTPPLGIFIYTIFRDGTPVGQQRMEFVGDGNKLRIISHTELDVTLLGLSVYGFDQQVEELHGNGKILSLTSEANDDGTDKKVVLTLEGDRLAGSFNTDKRRNIDPTLPTSLFWQKPATGATHVIDTVRGKTRDVTVTDRGAETLNLPIGRVEAHHFSMTGEMKRELWYDASGILVAGQVTARDGSTVRQELQQRP